MTGTARLADGKSVILAKVRALPEDGKANMALLRLLARALDVPVSKLRLASGATSRIKTVAIDGEPDQLAASLARIVFSRR